MNEKEQLPAWERASRDNDLYRIEVPGGWIYRQTTYHGGVSLEFVPFPTRSQE